jgi:hypothetical protein
MIVRHEKITVILILHPEEVLESPEIVAQVQVSG